MAIFHLYKGIFTNTLKKKSFLGIKQFWPWKYAIFCSWLNVTSRFMTSQASHFRCQSGKVWLWRICITFSVCIISKCPVTYSMWIPGCHHCLACSAHTLPSVATYLDDSFKQSQNDAMLNLKMLKDLSKVSCIPALSEVITLKNMSRSEFYICCGQGASSFWETWTVKISISSVFIEWDLILLKWFLLNLARELAFREQRPRLQNHLNVLICLILVSSALDATGLTSLSSRYQWVQHAFTSRSHTTGSGYQIQSVTRHG